MTESEKNEFTLYFHFGPWKTFFSLSLSLGWVKMIFSRLQNISSMKDLSFSLRDRSRPFFLHSFLWHSHTHKKEPCQTFVEASIISFDPSSYSLLGAFTATAGGYRSALLIKIGCVSLTMLMYSKVSIKRCPRFFGSFNPNFSLYF